MTSLYRYALNMATAPGGVDLGRLATGLVAPPATVLPPKAARPRCGAKARSRLAVVPGTRPLPGTLAARVHLTIRRFGGEMTIRQLAAELGLTWSELRPAVRELRAAGHAVPGRCQ